MSMVLPDSINPFLFVSHDGRLTTEAQSALCAAQQTLANGRFIDDPVQLERAIIIAGLYAQSQGWPRHLAFPVLGMIVGGNDLKVWSNGGLRGWIVTRWMRVTAWYVERILTQQYGPKAPGWNDYFMALWFLTGADPYIEELHARATRQGATGEDKTVEVSAMWMVNSVRRQYPDFDEALTALETRSGRSAVATSLEGPGYTSMPA